MDNRKSYAHRPISLIYHNPTTPPPKPVFPWLGGQLIHVSYNNPTDVNRINVNHDNPPRLEQGSITIHYQSTRSRSSFNVLTRTEIFIWFRVYIQGISKWDDVTGRIRRLIPWSYPLTHQKIGSYQKIGSPYKTHSRNTQEATT